MTDCAYYMELISAELDGELTEAERARLTAHLEQCPDCRRYRQALASVSGALADSLEPPPATLARSVMARVKALPVPGSAPEPEAAPAAREGSKRRLARGPVRLAALAAALALVVWAGYKALPRAGSAAPAGADNARTMESSAEEPETPMEAPAAYMSATGAEDSAAAADQEAGVTGASAETAASEETAGEAQGPAESAEPELDRAQWESAQLLASDGSQSQAAGEEALAFLTESVLTETSPAARPDREGDWTLTLRAVGGEEETYILWQEGERLYWAPAAGGEAWLAGASPEELAGAFQP